MHKIIRLRNATLFDVHHNSVINQNKTENTFGSFSAHFAYLLFLVCFCCEIFMNNAVQKKIRRYNYCSGNNRIEKIREMCGGLFFFFALFWVVVFLNMF